MSRARRRAAPVAAPARRDRLPALVAGLSLGYLALVVWVVVRRVAYPYELEFVEGAVLEQVARLRHGLPIYVAPSLAYVPLNYTPLGIWLGALASALLGESLFAVRMVSVLASAAAMFLLWKLVRFESGRRAPAWLAVGLFAAMFRLGGAWLDVARSDSLQLALLLALAWWLRTDGSRWRMPVGTGVLLAVAFLAKQSALVAAAPLVAWLLVRDPRRALVLAAVAAVLIAAEIAALDAASHGWFRYYAFTVPGFHAADGALARGFPWRDLGRPFWPLAALLAAAALRPGVPRSPARVGFALALALGFVGLAWLLRSYRGGYDNVLMPAHAAIALVAALAFSRLTASAPGSSSAPAWRWGACAAVALQLVLLRWSPVRQVPTAADRAAGDTIVEGLRAYEGRVLVPTHPYLLRRAGRPGGAHVMPLMDVIRDGHGPLETRLARTLNDSLRAHAWDLLVLDNRDWLAEGATEAGYQLVAPVFGDSVAFWTVTGMRTRPQWVRIAPGRTWPGAAAR